MIYLIQYDRAHGQLLRLQAFTAQEKGVAEEARLRMETLDLAQNQGYEVVLIEAKNQDELRTTHRRYFETLEQLINDLPVAVR